MAWLAAARQESDWVSCPRCRDLIYGKSFHRNMRVCPACTYHARLTAPERLEHLLGTEDVKPIDARSAAEDPLEFADLRPYAERLRDMRANTGLDEAVLCALGSIDGRRCVVAVMDFRFLGGSLGAAVGERITVAAETALRERVPLVIVAASGGARMQEGALSLMQMAKTSQALAQLDEAGVLTISLITDPTYGGVAASFATLTDVVLSEPGARMGFAGPRVIEQTIRQRLPEGFQTAEFLLANGLIDDVTPRAAVRSVLSRLVAAGSARHHPTEVQPDEVQPPEGKPDEVQPAEGKPGKPGDPLIRDPAELPVRDPWPIVQLARHLGRPTTLDYAGYLLDGFHELHGDRMSADCPAVVGGIGRLDGRPVMLIGHQKGHNTRELLARNFGMPIPAGYRKTARLMRLAAKLSLPIITLIDTPGAYPGIEAEERGQAVAIAENLRLMASLPVPIVAVVTGEGGSGGALALGVADRVLAMGNAIYSVISPEGCAAILWRDAGAAPQAAAALRLDSRALLEQRIIDGVIPEPEGGAHQAPAQAAGILRQVICARIRELSALDGTELIQARRQRFRRFGGTGHPGLEGGAA